jgi:aspartate/methionine/tyrosine aminotransferase
MDGVRIAERMGRIQPFYVMDLLARARELERSGRDLVHMEVGEPDFATPEPIVRAGQKVLAEGRIRYTPALGLPELREAIAGHYADRFGVTLDPGLVAVTPGASGALLLALGVLVNPGDEVLMADPGYPCNRHFVELLEGRPLSLPVGPETGYQLTAELVEAAWTPKTRVVLVATPSNPTGTLLRPDQLRALQRVVGERGGMLIVDEIYHQLVFDQPAYTALSQTSELFVINSFSKYFCMTGWRLGWLVAPAAYLDAIDRLAQNIFLAAPTLSQHAALAAFSEETFALTDQRRQAFRERRDFLLPALRELGFDLPLTPEGAFYLYAGCKKQTDDSFAFAQELLERGRVAVTPGRDFGNNRPKEHLRFAYTTETVRLEEGVERIRRFIAAGG